MNKIAYIEGYLNKTALKAPTSSNLIKIIDKMTPGVLARLPLVWAGAKGAVKKDNKFNKMFQSLVNIKERGKWNKTTRM